MSSFLLSSSEKKTFLKKGSLFQLRESLSTIFVAVLGLLLDLCEAGGDKVLLLHVHLLDEEVDAVEVVHQLLEPGLRHREQLDRVSRGWRGVVVVGELGENKEANRFIFRSHEQKTSRCVPLSCLRLQKGSLFTKKSTDA